MNKKAEVIRVYLPPDANTLLSVADHCLRSRNYVNVIVAGKQPALQWLTWTRPSRTARRGIGIWEWASTDDGGEPDVVMACGGDVPTLETLAAVDAPARAFPRPEGARGQRRRPDDAAAAERASARAVGRATSTRSSRPTSRSSSPSTAIPWLIHRLTYRRTNHDNLHVRGYKEEGHDDDAVRHGGAEQLDRFHLVIDVIDRVPSLGARAAHVRQLMMDTRLRARQYTRDHGEDPPEIQRWSAAVVIACIDRYGQRQ